VAEHFLQLPGDATPRISLQLDDDPLPVFEVPSFQRGLNGFGRPRGDGVVRGDRQIARSSVAWETRLSVDDVPA
jgi:hypothetical protein